MQISYRNRHIHVGGDYSAVARLVRLKEFYLVQRSHYYSKIVVVIQFEIV